MTKFKDLCIKHNLGEKPSDWLIRLGIYLICLNPIFKFTQWGFKDINNNSITLLLIASGVDLILNIMCIKIKD